LKKKQICGQRAYRLSQWLVESKNIWEISEKLKLHAQPLDKMAKLLKIKNF
jgi:hypothetical protein